MTLVLLRCPHCDGDINLDDSNEFGFCMYCGSKVMIEKKPETIVNNIFMNSNSSRFYLLVYRKGELTQHSIKDSVTMDLVYRDDAAMGDPKPLGIKILNGNTTIPNKLNAGNTGPGRLEIVYSGNTFNLTKEQKIKAKINGIPLLTNSSKLGFGDMIAIDDIIFRIQPLESTSTSQDSRNLN